MMVYGFSPVQRGKKPMAFPFQNRAGCESSVDSGGERHQTWHPITALGPGVRGSRFHPETRGFFDWGIQKSRTFRGIGGN